REDPRGSSRAGEPRSMSNVVNVDFGAKGKRGDNAELRRLMLPERRYLSTKEAAAFCGMTPNAFRMAAYRGKVRCAGRRGGAGERMWAVAELERFLLGGGNGDNEVG